MKYILVILISIFVASCDTGSKSSQVGKIVKVTEHYGDFGTVDLRVDCKNFNCPIETMYFKRNPRELISSNMFRAIQMDDVKIIYTYKDYLFFKVLEEYNFIEQ